ncbi:MAG: hypothetical protein ACPIOQ_81040, partial [Promethearchaeia archaeon]
MSAWTVEHEGSPRWTFVGMQEAACRHSGHQHGGAEQQPCCPRTRPTQARPESAEAQAAGGFPGLRILMRPCLGHGHDHQRSPRGRCDAKFAKVFTTDQDANKVLDLKRRSDERKVWWRETLPRQ